MRALASAVTLCGLTRKRWTAGSGPTYCGTEDTSVAKAKQTISSYRKAVSDPAGLAELMVFYCESAPPDSATILGNQDEGYFDALVRMFEQALPVIMGNYPRPIAMFWSPELDQLRLISHNFGCGVGDDMDSLLARYSAT